MVRLSRRPSSRSARLAAAGAGGLLLVAAAVPALRGQEDDDFDGPDFSEPVSAEPAAPGSVPADLYEPTLFGPPKAGPRTDEPAPFGTPAGPDDFARDWSSPPAEAFAPDEDRPGFADDFKRVSPEPTAGEFADAPAADRPADPAAAPPVTVPGAASVEPVLRAVYRPHPTRVEAVFAFLKANAAAGVDVSLRRSTAEGTDAAETELVVVAPAEQQRALGAFLALCVSAEPSSAGHRSGGSRDDFGAARFAPADDLGAAPDAFDAEPGFGGYGDAFAEPGDFGGPPASSRTSRRNP